MDKSPALALPLAVTVIVHPRRSKDSSPPPPPIVSFPTSAEDLLSFLLDAPPSPEDVALIRPFSDAFAAAIDRDGWTPHVVLQKAVEDFAARGFTHHDLRWRHVGLLPMFDNETGEVVSLRPILIDLENVSRAPPELAAQHMHASVVQLLESVAPSPLPAAPSV